MPNVLIYHNPNCSKSRQALALLQENGINPTVIEYLQHPPSVETLQSILLQLKLSARALMRSQEKVFQEQGLDDPSLSASTLVQKMHDQPILIQRPIVIVGDQAIIARPPTRILEIL